MHLKCSVREIASFYEWLRCHVFQSNSRVVVSRIVVGGDRQQVWSMGMIKLAQCDSRFLAVHMNILSTTIFVNHIDQLHIDCPVWKRFTTTANGEA